MDFSGDTLKINFHKTPEVIKLNKNLSKSKLNKNLLSKSELNKNLSSKSELNKNSLLKGKITNNLAKNCRPFYSVLKNAPTTEKLVVSKKVEILQKMKDEKEIFDKIKNINDFDSINEKLREFLISYLNSNQLTVVQSLSWTAIQSNMDILIKSPSGTGKTLAFLIPIIDTLIKKKPKISRNEGIFAIILVPTKELAKQISDILNVILRNFNWIVSGGLFGCDKRKAEKVRLRKGLNIIVATPGRLHDHLINTKSLILNNLKWFIVDEADLLLDLGYDKKFQEIKNCISSNIFINCQKIFLSATINDKFLKCYSLLFCNNVYFVDAFNERIIETDLKNFENKIIESLEFNYPINLKQKILQIPTKLRLIGLIWLLKYIIEINKTNIRIIIFFNSIASATFHHQLLQNIKETYIIKNDEEIKFYLLHGSMEIKERMKIYNLFSEKNKCILFTTDVASRGLDFPMVDWIIQYNPAREIREYVHRVGRTCRMGNKGNAIIFLEPQELSYIDLLYKNNLIIETMDIYLLFKLINKNINQLENNATLLYKEIKKNIKNDIMYKLALSAYNASIKSYTSYPREMKNIFNIKNLNQGHLAESFTINETPKEIQNILKNKNIELNRKRKINNKIDLFKTSKKLSLKSASALLTEEYNGGIVSGPGTKKSNKK